MERLAGFILFILVNFIICLKFRWPGRLWMLFIFFIFIPCCSMPMFLNHVVKARQVEAKHTLGMIAKNQKTYFDENDTYADSCKKLEFTTVRRYEGLYNYKIELGPDKKSYTAIAWLKAPGLYNCGECDDVWSINQNLKLTNDINERSGCGSSSYVCPKVPDISCPVEEGSQYDLEFESLIFKYYPFWFIGVPFFIIVAIFYDERYKKKKPDRNTSEHEESILAQNEPEKCPICGGENSYYDANGDLFCPGCRKVIGRG